MIDAARPALAESDPGVAEAYIRDWLPIREIAEAPGLRLHLATPASGLYRLTRLNPGFLSPYWVYLWAGGLALARWLQERPETVTGRRVLDLGTGSGLVAILAARAGAASVLAADVDPFAISACRMNAALNEAAVTPALADLTAGPPPEVDVVLVSDLFYELGLAKRVGAFLDRCLAADVEVLVGDPWRADLPRDRLQTLAEYQVRDFGGRHPGPAAVFRYLPASE